MSEMNPIILLQLITQYHNYREEGKRTFRFTKNGRLRVHTETETEEKKRKSAVKADTRRKAEYLLQARLRDALRNRVGGKVYIDPAMKKIAVPLQMSVSESGFGVLPCGSRVSIPKGKKIRAFTYWEKVNDIDLSGFGLTEDGRQEEFSWRNMYDRQGGDITFSGDQTSGYNGGSEYFDIDIDQFRANHPEFRYIVFCDNVFSGGGSVHFNQCLATAGFMMRDREDSGEVFEPKTVETSFRLTADSSFCYMFAIDLTEREMIWLNIAREGNHAIAGNTKIGNVLLDKFHSTEIFSVWDLYLTAAEKLASRPEEADIVVSGSYDPNPVREGQKVICPWDIEEFIRVLQPNAG